MHKSSMYKTDYIIIINTIVILKILMHTHRANTRVNALSHYNFVFTALLSVSRAQYTVQDQQSKQMTLFINTEQSAHETTVSSQGKSTIRAESVIWEDFKP